MRCSTLTLTVTALSSGQALGAAIPSSGFTLPSTVTTGSSLGSFSQLVSSLYNGNAPTSPTTTNFLSQLFTTMSLPTTKKPDVSALNSLFNNALTQAGTTGTPDTGALNTALAKMLGTTSTNPNAKVFDSLFGTLFSGSTLPSPSALQTTIGGLFNTGSTQPDMSAIYQLGNTVFGGETPGVSNIKIANSALALATGAGQTVTTQTSAISKMLSGVVTGMVVPQLQSSLKAITGQLTDVQQFIDANVVQTVVPLAQDQAATIPAILTQTTSTLTGVQTLLTSMLTSVPAALQPLIKTELQNVLNAAQGAVTPVVTLAQSLGGSASGGVTPAISGLTTNLQSVATTGLGPLQIALAKII